MLHFVVMPRCGLFSAKVRNLGDKTCRWKNFLQKKIINPASFARIFLLKFLLHVPTKDKMRVVSLISQRFV